MNNEQRTVILMDRQIPSKQEKECIRIATKGCRSRRHQISSLTPKRFEEYT